MQTEIDRAYCPKCLSRNVRPNQHDNNWHCADCKWEGTKEELSEGE